MQLHVCEQPLTHTFRYNRVFSFLSRLLTFLYHSSSDSRCCVFFRPFYAIKHFHSPDRFLLPHRSPSCSALLLFFSFLFLHSSVLFSLFLCEHSVFSLPLWVVSLFTEISLDLLLFPEFHLERTPLLTSSHPHELTGQWLLTPPGA